MRRLRRVPLVRLLARLGYEVDPNGEDLEQPFRCNLHGTGQDHKPSARSYPKSPRWHCVDATQPVLTARGWMPLASIRAGQVALDGMGLWGKTIAYLDQGERDVIEVRTTPGYWVRVTNDHEVYVVGRGWVQAGGLKVGDVLDVPLPKSPAFSSQRRLPFSVARWNGRTYRNASSLCLPQHWSQRLGEVLGYVVGDGWVVLRDAGKKSGDWIGLTSSVEDAEDARTAFRYLQQIAGGRGGETRRTDKTRVNGRSYQQNQVVFSVGNNDLVEFFNKLGAAKREKPEDRRVPFALWNAPRSAIRGFLRGLFATDGSVFFPKDRKSARVVLYSISRNLLLDVQLLLLQFGIRCRVHAPQRKSSKMPRRCHALTLATSCDVVTFRETVGFANRRKETILARHVFRLSGTRPMRAKVKEIIAAGRCRVADITMPGDPSFVAGGIRVHNCFACSRSRDIIDTYRERTGAPLEVALDRLEELAGLPPMSFDPEEDEEDDTPRWSDESPVVAEDPIRAFDRLLGTFARARALPLSTVLQAWELVDHAAVDPGFADTLRPRIGEIRDRLSRAAYQP